MAFLPTVSWASTESKPETKSKNESTEAKEEIKAETPLNEASYSAEEYVTEPEYEKGYPADSTYQESQTKKSGEETLSHNYLFYLLYKFKYCNVYEKEELPELHKK